jgi:membrane associated rhomboid family serine protease
MRSMSQAQYHPIEAVLRLCAQAQPQPWYYRAFAQQSGVHPDQLMAILELLWLEGLLQKAPGSPETGPGVMLTERGKEVVGDPEAMRQLVAGQLVRPGDVGATVRQSLRRQSRPIVTQAIVGANVVVFAIGAILAARTPGLLQEYLMGFMNRGHTRAWAGLLDRMGILTVSDLVRGQWWRLMTTAFLHDGLLHLGMNMYALWMLGAFVEQTWGRWRFLVLYLLSACASSCLAIPYMPGGLGASGAICGILAVDGVWILLYGRYLPQSMARRGRSAMVTNIILIVFISLIPGVGWQAHLAGALVGAVAAVALHFQRFGSPALRVLGVLALPLLAWGCFAYMKHASVTSKLWHAAEMQVFNRDLIPPISESTKGAFQIYKNDVKPLLERHATRRDEAETNGAIEKLDEKTAELGTVAGKLQRSSPFHDDQVEEARTTALAYVNAVREACEESARCLRAGKDWKKTDEKGLEQKWEKAEKQRLAWRALFR